MQATRIQAKFVLVSPQILLHPGQVVVGGGRILAVSSRCDEKADVDLGDCVILPGLINSHTHLEFSDLQQPLPAGDNFPAWIRSVIQHRRRAGELAADAWRLQRRRAMAGGIVEAAQSGTAFMADVVSLPWSIDDLPTQATHCAQSGQPHRLPAPRPRILALPEVIGLTQERLQATIGWSKQLLLHSTQHPCLQGYGLSPHAPYSLLWSELCALYEQIEEPEVTAMHVAESREELEWLETGRGPFRDSFESLGIPLTNARPRLETVLDFLMRRKRALLIHGNYLNVSQISALASDKRVAVVYCPRTHRHFSHERYPLGSYLQHGVNLLLGTDSRASNPDLNIWSEVVLARRTHAELSPETALSAVTTAAAEALGVSEHYGSIAKGKRSFLNSVACPVDWTNHNLLENLTNHEMICRPIASE